MENLLHRTSFIKDEEGSVTLLSILGLMMGFILASLVVVITSYYIAQNQLQDDCDGAAQAASHAALISDEGFSFVDPTEPPDESPMGPPLDLPTGITIDEEKAIYTAHAYIDQQFELQERIPASETEIELSVGTFRGGAVVEMHCSRFAYLPFIKIFNEQGVQREVTSISVPVVGGGN